MKVKWRSFWRTNFRRTVWASTIMNIYSQHMDGNVRPQAFWINQVFSIIPILWLDILCQKVITKYCIFRNQSIIQRLRGVRYTYEVSLYAELNELHDITFNTVHNCNNDWFVTRKLNTQIPKKYVKFYGNLVQN